MSQTNLCRLCVKILKDHKSIYKENGEGNEAYEWIYKYFHPMLLNHNETQHLKAICLECWNHLDNFHKFQTNVYEVHALLTTENEEDHIIKTEVEEIANLVGDAENMSLDYNAIDKIKEEFISLTAEETMPEAIELGRKTNVLENEFDLEESSKNSTNVEKLTNASDPIDIEETMPEAVKLGRKTNVLEIDCIWQESSENSTNVETLSNDNEPPIDIAIAEDDVNEENICENDTDDSSDYFDDIPLAALASAKKKIAGKKCLDFLDGSRTYSDTTFDALLAKYMPNIKCVKCRKSFTNLSQLIEHFCKKHAKQKFYIICCNLQCEKLKKLKDHLLLHQDPNNFKCKLYGNSYTRKKIEEKPKILLNASDSVNLLRVTESQSNLPAEIKSNEFPLNNDIFLTQPKLEIMDVHDKNSEDEFEEYMQKPDNYSKLIAETEANAMATDQSNIERSVAIKDSIVSPHISQRKLNSLISKCIPNLKCELCRKIFKPNLLSLEKHFCKQHPKHKFYIICCQRKLVGLPQIRKHMLEHNNQNIQSHKCLKCNNTFQTQRALNMHQNKAHDHDEIFKCEDECGFTCKNRSALMRHIAEKHNYGIAKFECKICAQYFPTAKILQIHDACQHTAGIPCDFCWFSCYAPSYINKHMTRMHSELLQFTCDNCNKGFKTKAALKIHELYCLKMITRIRCSWKKNMEL